MFISLNLPGLIAWIAIIASGIVSYWLCHQVVETLRPPVPPRRPWFTDRAGYAWAPVESDPDGWACLRSGASGEAFAVRSRIEISQDIGIAEQFVPDSTGEPEDVKIATVQDETLVDRNAT